MSSAGHILDMIKKQASNRALQIARKEKYMKNFNKFETISNSKTYNVEKFGNKSTSELNEAKEKALSEVRLHERKIWIKTIGVLMLFVLLIYLMIK